MENRQIRNGDLEENEREKRQKKTTSKRKEKKRQVKARQENKRCLVHCMAGISRSSSLVLAYLMKHQKMSLKEAFLHTREMRDVIEPNFGFVKQLMQFEHKLFSKNSIAKGTDLSRL